MDLSYPAFKNLNRRYHTGTLYRTLRTPNGWLAGRQGALGINTALFSFSFVVFNFLATATTPLVATALSSGDKQQVRRLGGR